MSDEDEDMATLVLDNGSKTCRMGYAGDDLPKFCFSNCLGRPLGYQGRDKQDFYVGEQAQAKRELLHIEYPVQRGIVTNWDAMEKIWDYGFSRKLDISPSDWAVVTSEPPLNPRGNTETMAQILFEQFGFSRFNTSDEADHILSGYGRGRGVVVSIGHGVTYVTSHYYTMSRHLAVRRADFGGHDLTLDLQQVLQSRGLTFTSSAEMEELCELKEKVVQTAHSKEKYLGIQEGTLPAGPQRCSLSDGFVVRMEGPDRFHSPELLFNESGCSGSYGYSGGCGGAGAAQGSPGIDLPSMVLEVLQESGIDIRDEIGFSVLLAGGTSSCIGLSTRLCDDLRACTETKRLKTVYYPDCINFSWIGKSILGSLSTFDLSCVTKAEYEEHGPCVIVRSPGIALAEREARFSANQ